MCFGLQELFAFLEAALDGMKELGTLEVVDRHLDMDLFAFSVLFASIDVAIASTEQEDRDLCSTVVAFRT